MNRSFFVTTPIYYVNDKPHIGHIYTNIISDILVRIMKLANYRGYLLTGTDEHGAKIISSAQKANKSIEDFVNQNSGYFQDLLLQFNISNDDFIRTTEERHKENVLNLWQALEKSNNIYLGHYSGWYIKKDESFYTEQELKELGISTNSPEVEWIEESNYFFKLSNWEKPLLEFYDKNPDFILPHKYRDEVINFVKNGLQDLSISREKVTWGISVPNSDQVIYVWLDALSNYLMPSYKDDSLWPCDLHVIGKDILKFHAIYWPAFLMAANKKLPKYILIHGLWTNEGSKISNSLGNTIDSSSLLKEFNVDLIRYALIRMLNIGNDGDFARDRVININNSELVNKIGNLIHRIIYFLYAFMNATTPNLSREKIENLYENEDLLKKITIYSKKWDKIIDEKHFKINALLEIIINMTEEGNIFFEQSKIWHKKSDYDNMSIIMFQSLELVRYIGIMLQAFIPESAKKILDHLDIDLNERRYQNLNQAFAIKSGQKINAPEIIFTKL